MPDDPDSLLSWALAVLPGPELLVVPCGSGATTIAVARLGRQACGADHDPGVVRRARESLRHEDDDVRLRTRFLVVEGPLPFDADSFDGALVDGGELSTEALLELVRSVVGVIRPEGGIGVRCTRLAAQRIGEMSSETLRVDGSRDLGGLVGVRLRVASPSRGAVAPEPAEASAPVEVRALLTALREDQRRLGQLEYERMSLRRELQDRAAADEAHAQERLRLEEELRALRQATDERAAEVARVRQELAAGGERVAAIQRELAAAEAARVHVEGRLAHALSEVEGLTERIGTVEQEARKRAEETASAQARERQTREQLDAARKKLRRQEASVEALEELRASRSYKLMRFMWRVKRRLRRPFSRSRQ
jgi:SAM-dependent methyltransferase